ncbi:peptidyl-prolyl cis-trans isomerase [Pyxidicoccus parkwayensis]|uniref:Peptidyl-prolyl cis-trans isomerase n=1 Tax=Pyxidicoccus parkwayensis TaxID=2813578 RepID=A0ABX7PAJ4_9BACT|nr:peptidylprolyl isomerase [Pyxidicoccus parkwaysis]QSQ27491.1 peptidyl-prolyl cis-trans isomerase [Pyxidicoccus parkwaysis]
MRRATRGVWPLSQLQLGVGGAVAGLSLAVWVATASAEPQPQVPSDVVATVNGHEVPRSRFQRLLTARRAEHGGRVEPGTPADLVLSAQVSSQLVNEQLIENAARKAGVAVTEQEVDAALDACSQHLGGPSGLRALIEARFSDIAELRTQLRIALLFERTSSLQSTAELPESVVQEFYERTVGSFAAPELTLEETTIRVQASDDADAVARKQSQATAAREAMAGEKGAAAPRAGQGMTSRRVSEAELAPEVRDALRDAQEGALTPVVRTSEGFTVVRLVKRHPAVRPAYAAARAGLIEELQRLTQEARAHEFMEELRKGADIQDGAGARLAASQQASPEARKGALGQLATMGDMPRTGAAAQPPVLMPAPASLRRADALPRQCGNGPWVGEVVP